MPSRLTGIGGPPQSRRKPPSASNAASRSVKGAERLARDIVRRIYERGMKPGDKFLSESEALAVFGVSRATLREALRYLQIQGVLRMRTGPGGGHFVGQPRPESLASTIALLLQFAGAPINCIIDARRIIEPVIVREAALNTTAADVAAMDRRLAEMEAHVDEDEPFMAAWFGLMDIVVGAAGNAFFCFMLPALWEIGRSGGFGSTAYGRAKGLAILRKLRDAMADRDAARASSAMDELFEMIREVLEDNYTSRLNRRVSWADVQDVL